MYFKKTTIIALLGAMALLGVSSAPALALEVNKSDLWFGGDKGIEVVWKTGKNLAYTKESPKVDPLMTNMHDYSTRHCSRPVSVLIWPTFMEQT